MADQDHHLPASDSTVGEDICEEQTDAKLVKMNGNTEDSFEKKNDGADAIVVRSGLKLKRGTLFKQKRRLDPRTIDLTIKKEQTGLRKTKAELAFLKRQEETAFERLSKRAGVSHREKVERFNKQMEELSEFNDVPKVSWTK